jgi:hypothetical protein
MVLHLVWKCSEALGRIGIARAVFQAGRRPALGFTGCIFGGPLDERISPAPNVKSGRPANAGSAMRCMNQEITIGASDTKGLEIVVLNFYFPDRLYERLPLVYAIAGLCAMTFLSGGLANFSGIVLCATSALVWNQRRQYRARQQIRAKFQRRQRRRNAQGI